MESLRSLYTLAALLAVASIATAQTADGQTTNDLALPVATARCAYTQTDAICASLNGSSERARDPGSTTAQAQFPARIPRPPITPRRSMAYPRGGYPSLGWRHPGHALIGALIGGGGAGTLAANTHPNGQTGPNVVGAIFCGGLGAVVGALIGNSLPWTHGERRPRQSWPDEEMASWPSLKSSKPASPQPDTPAPPPA